MPEDRREGTAPLNELDAVILAGGLGTRLRAVVPNAPKVLATVAGRPFLGYLVEWLRKWGISRFILCLGHLGEQVRSYVASEESLAGCRIVFSEEREPRGTGGALRLAVHHFCSDPVLVLNGDSFLGLPLSDFLAFHHRHAADITIGTTRVENAAPFGSLQVRSNGRIYALNEKVSARTPAWINGGVYLLRRALAKTIAEGWQSLERDVLPSWITTYKAMAFLGSFAFLDIGTPPSYQQAQALLPLYVQQAAAARG